MLSPYLLLATALATQADHVDPFEFATGPVAHGNATNLEARTVVLREPPGTAFSSPIVTFPAPGQEVTIEAIYSATNPGDQEFIAVDILVDGSLLCDPDDLVSSGFNAASCDGFSVPNTPFDVTALIDSFAEINESDEDDNRAERSYDPTSGGSIDLIAGTVELTTEPGGGQAIDDPAPGDELYLQMRYDISVTTGRTHYRRLELRFNGERHCGVLGATPSSALSRRTWCSRPVTVPEGVFSIGGEVDYRGEIAESDESNNVVSRQYGAAATPEIAPAARTVVGAVGSGDGLLAPQAGLVRPDVIVFDTDNNLYIADSGGRRIRRVDARTGLIDTIVGTGTTSGPTVDVPGIQASVDDIGDMVIDSAGRLYFSSDFEVRVWDPETTVVTRLFEVPGLVSRHKGLAVGTLVFLTFDVSLALSPDETTLVITDRGRHAVHRLDLINGTQETLVPGSDKSGFAGDGGPASEAILHSPSAIATDGQTIYILDSGNRRIRSIDAAGTIRTFVNYAREDKGLGPGFIVIDFGSSGEMQLRGEDLYVRVGDRFFTVATSDGTVTENTLPADLPPVDYFRFDRASRLHVANSTDGRVRRIGADGQLIVVAGGLADAGFCSASLDRGLVLDPADIAVTPDGALIVVDDQTHGVVRIDETSASATVIAGTLGTRGYLGDGGSAREALFDRPNHVAVAPNGDIVVYDSFNRRLRRIDGQGVIETVAGNGEPVGEFIAIGEIATETPIFVSALAIAPDNSIHFARGGLIVRINPDNGRLQRVAGSEDLGFAGDGGPALEAVFETIRDIEFDAEGHLYVADPENVRLRRIRDGVVETIAGNGNVDGLPDNGGDGGPALAADTFPGAVTVRANGDVIIAEEIARRLRWIPAGTDLIHALEPTPEEGDPLSSESSLFGRPAQLAAGPGDRLFVADALRDKVIAIELSPSSMRLPLLTDPGDRLGSAIAASGDRFAVGVPDDRDTAAGTGSVAIYRIDGCRFNLEQRITAPNGFNADGFGAALALDQSRLVVGTRAHSSGKGSALSAAIFERVQAGWTFKQPLSVGTDGDGFGRAVAIEGDTIAVGAPATDGDSGTVYIFDEVGGRFDQRAQIDAASGEVGFGSALAINKRRLAVGAPGTAAGGPVGQAVAGTVALYDLVEQNLMRSASHQGQDPSFGSAVSLVGDQVLVGAPQANDSGAAFLFDIDGGSLAARAQLQVADLGADAAFGQALALDRQIAYVGAPSAGTDGSGAIFGFDLSELSTGKGPGNLRKIDPSFYQRGLGSAMAVDAGRIFGGAPGTGADRGDALAFNVLFNLGGVSGLWFDPTSDGEGFNVISSAAGTLVYFFGYSQTGERLWLVSDLITEPLAFDRATQVTMFEATGGTFAAPRASSEALAIWGSLSLTFQSAVSGVFVLGGADGSKVASSVQLADAQGVGAGSGGLWFDPALDGEGYNVIASAFGTIVYFYGYGRDGQRLWLVSDLIPANPEPGDRVNVTMFEARGGTFDRPRPSAQALAQWGNLNLRINACGEGVFTLDGSDGRKVSRVTQLLTIASTSCQSGR